MILGYSWFAFWLMTISVVLYPEVESVLNFDLWTSCLKVSSSSLVMVLMISALILFASILFFTL